jgi:hypothetical protein
MVAEYKEHRVTKEKDIKKFLNGCNVNVHHSHHFWGVLGVAWIRWVSLLLFASRTEDRPPYSTFI